MRVWHDSRMGDEPSKTVSAVGYILFGAFGLWFVMSLYESLL